jgi:hypothetical protein
MSILIKRNEGSLFRGFKYEEEPMKKRVKSFQDLEVYRLAKKLGEKVWDLTAEW